MNRPSNSRAKKTRQAREKTAHDSLIVGLGASAGGIKALQAFFDTVPADIGVVFVVIMHISPDFESNLAQVLQLHTAMPVTVVNEPLHVEANRVYVIPPGKHLSLQDGVLNPVEPQQPAGRRLAIDLFFRTLSVACGPRAVAVVLSGADSDGAIGIKHIKEQGGLTIAQDPNEAEFDSMPRAVINTGMVDWVLPISRMAPQLLAFVRNEQRMHVPPEDPPKTEDPVSDDNSGGPLAIQQIPSSTDETALLEVLRVLRGQTGHDFIHYKRATILRRVARRLQVNLLEDIASYLDFIRTHPAEVTALLHDLLISVTNFFRDHDAFVALESHIPQLFAGKQSNDQVRIWVAGCATGEEAYSVAMLLQEHAGRLDNPPSIQVFATDLDDDVIQIARSGVYPSTIEADVSAERLRQFFYKEQGRYRIKKELRELVFFSVHDLLKDSPFSRLDMITCRNLLIYLKREAQEGIFDIFHFALRPGALLFLGGSEGLNDNHTLFAPLDKRYRIYVRRTTPRAIWQIPALPISQRLVPAVPSRPLKLSSSPSVSTEAPPPLVVPPVPERRNLLFGDLHLTMLERFAPPSVIINDNYDIVHLSEHAGQFLQFPGGEVSSNLLRVVHPALRIELRTALFRAGKGEADVQVNRLSVPVNGISRLINLHVRSVRKPETLEGFLLVVFEPVLESKESPHDTPNDAQIVESHLEAENQHLKEQLRATVEQYETSLEELKASNEELHAINEELRSTAEELETSKEELQSINEELTTVNHELKINVEELSRVNSDLQNLMASTEIGTIFLDRQLCIKRFTPRVQELFNLIPTDIGRPLSDITHKLNYILLSEDADRVLRDLRVSEREVRSDERWFLARALPYRTLDDHIDGVVLTFVDITERKKTERERVALEREAALLAERNRLAQELHDTLAQSIAGIKLQLDAAESAVESAPGKVLQHINRARDAAQQSLFETRRVIQEMHYPIIEGGSLSQALRRLAEQMTNGVRVEFREVGVSVPLPVSQELDLYRIGQEALSNSLQHAEARNVLMEISYLSNAIRLRVKDDGCGFNPTAPTSGFGLMGMQERAMRLKAQWEIRSMPEEGTEIVVTLPDPTR